MLDGEKEKEVGAEVEVGTVAGEPRKGWMVHMDSVVAHHRDLNHSPLPRSVVAAGMVLPRL